MTQSNKSINVTVAKKETGVENNQVLKLEPEPGKKIAKIHSIQAIARVINKETVDGICSVNGEVETFVSYETNDGEICSTKVDGNFNNEINAAGAVSLLIDAKVIKAELIGFDENLITVNVCFVLQTSYIMNEEIGKEFDEVAGLVLDKNVVDVSKILGAGSSNFSLTFTPQIKVANGARIIHREASVGVNSAIAGIDCVTLEGTVFATFLVMEDDKLHRIQHQEEFKREVDCFGSNPGAVVDACAKISSIMSGIVDGENAGDINATVDIYSSVIVSVVEESCVVSDAYSVLSPVNVSVEYAPVQNLKNIEYSKHNIVLIADILEKIGVDEVISVINPRIVIANIDYKSEGCQVEGVVDATVIYKNNMEESVLSFNDSLPFVTTIKTNQKIEFQDIVVNEFKLMAGNSITIDASLFVKILEETAQEIVYVSDIVVSDEIAKDESAVKIYTIQENEKLFDIAKNLNVTPETLIAQNPDLENGVVPGERIYVYMPIVVNFN